MTLHTQQSLSGSLASEPQQSITESGDTRFYVRIGQPHFRREDGGGFTELEPTFHDLVAYRATAERALAAKLRAPIGTPPAPRMSSHERPGFPGPAQPRWVCEVTVAAPWLEPAPDLKEAPFGTSPFDDFDGPLTNEPPHPVNWNSLTAEEAEVEWIELNRWVNWLRRTYGLPASVVPPFWHRHTELAWELSALHLHWLCAYDPDQHGSAPFGWHPDFADARQRLRDWVATSGTRLKRDRPTRQTSWPGEPPADAVEDVVIANREEDFLQFVVYDVARRRVAEGEFHANAKFPDAWQRSIPPVCCVGCHRFARCIYRPLNENFTGQVLRTRPWLLPIKLVIRRTSSLKARSAFPFRLMVARPSAFPFPPRRE